MRMQNLIIHRNFPRILDLISSALIWVKIRKQKVFVAATFNLLCIFQILFGSYVPKIGIYIGHFTQYLDQMHRIAPTEM